MPRHLRLRIGRGQIDELRARLDDVTLLRASGAPLAAGGAPGGARFADPHSYTPKHLADKILTGKISDPTGMQATIAASSGEGDGIEAAE